MSQICPLCQDPRCPKFHVANTGETYWQCPNCELVFKDPSQLLEPMDEKVRYEGHNNTRECPGYVDFLNPARAWVGEVMPKGARGLDYGCGPGPVLAELLSEDGFEVDLYDPFFFYRDLQDARAKYDFIVCTEAAEHFHKPRKEVESMAETLKPSGKIFWMTDLWREQHDFETWHYRKDPTHVSFYTELTARWIGDFWGKSAEFRGRNLISWM